jgi:O-antigen/teichoic acid export membrane protein
MVLSAANFLVGLILIRLTTDDDYGSYLLVLTALLLLGSLQNAWLSGPLAIVASRKSTEERRVALGVVRQAQARWLVRALLVAQVVPLGGLLLGLFTAKLALLLVIVIACAWATLRREHLRQMLLMYSRPQSVLIADVLFGSTLVVGAFLATRSHSLAVVWAVLVYFIATTLAERTMYRMIGRDPGWVRGDAGPVLREIRAYGFWATTGALTYWLYSQAANYILAGMVDLTAVADVNATRLLLMPVTMLTVGVSSLLTPTAALWYAKEGLETLTRRLVGFVVGMMIIDLLYLSAVWLSRDWLIDGFMHKHIVQRDELLMLWAGVVLIGVARDVMLTALLALGLVKSLALQGAVCAVVSLSVTFIGISWFGAAAGLIGQIAGEVINLAGILVLLRGAYRSAYPVPEKATATSG